MPTRCRIECHPHGSLPHKLRLKARIRLACVGPPADFVRYVQDSVPIAVRCVQVDVWKPKDPIAAAWQGGSRVAASAQFAHLAMSKADYEENGIR